MTQNDFLCSTAFHSVFFTSAVKKLENISNKFYRNFFELTAAPSWIFKFLVPVLRLLVSTPGVCPPRTKVMDENCNDCDAHNDCKDGSEGLKHPGRRSEDVGVLRCLAVNLLFLFLQVVCNPREVTTKV